MSIDLNAKLFERLNAVNSLQSKSVKFGKQGLKSNTIDAIEDQLEFKLPNDMHFLLKNLHDPQEVFFPWSKFKLKTYKKSIAWILSGIEFDIEHNATWLERWGERPSNLKDAKAKMRDEFINWPKIVPIFGHRYLIAEPCVSGNPVLSIMQTDIICYGSTLGAYLVNEFIQRSEAPEDWTPNKAVSVWTEL